MGSSHAFGGIVGGDSIQPRGDAYPFVYPRRLGGRCCRDVTARCELRAARRDWDRRNAWSGQRGGRLLRRLVPGGSAGSQWTPRNLRPVTFPAASERTQRSGGTITSGWISLARSKPASSEIIGVSVTPPGTRTLTVAPVPSRSFAMIALSASSAALDGP